MTVSPQPNDVIGSSWLFEDADCSVAVQVALVCHDSKSQCSSSFLQENMDNLSRGLSSRVKWGNYLQELTASPSGEIFFRGLCRRCLPLCRDYPPALQGKIRDPVDLVSGKGSNFSLCLCLAVSFFAEGCSFLSR